LDADLDEPDSPTLSYRPGGLGMGSPYFNADDIKCVLILDTIAAHTTLAAVVIEMELVFIEEGNTVLPRYWQLGVQTRLLTCTVRFFSNS
jgi:hypothetical protein